MREFYMIIIAVAATTTGVFSAEIPTACPLQDSPNKTIHIAHESDCSKFYKCLNGEKIEMICPEYIKGERLCFNPETQICDWPRNVMCCKESKLRVDQHCPSFGNDTRAVWPHPVSCNLYFTCQNGIKSLGSCDKGELFDHGALECRPSGKVKCNKDVVCPSAGSSKIVIVPHECDCAKYYECTSEGLVRKQCPSGMKFDYIQDECVLAEKAVCNIVSSAVLPKSPVVEECPLKGSHENVTLPHECSCDKYYVCKDGRAVVHRCKEGTVYDYVNEICGVPEVVNCERSVPELEAPPRRVPTDSVVTASLLTISVQATCPATGRWNIPDETDCKKYYMCKDGKIINHMSCLGSHYFNEKVGQCDIPENTDCKGRPTPILPPPSTPPVPTQHPYDPECLPLECKGIILPDPNDCSSFFQCVNGYKVPRKCRDGLLYNKDLQMCDYPQYVMCDDYICTETSPVGQTVPHECQCHLYYECFGKDARRRECYKGYDYDYVLKRCVPKGEAKCYKKPSTNVFRNETKGQCIFLENV